MQFSPDGKRMVTASTDKTAIVWDAESGKLLTTLSGHEQAVVDARFSPDGLRIVTASSDMSARVWDAQTGALLTSLKGHKGPIDSVQLSGDGERILTFQSNTFAGGIYSNLWEATSGKLLATFAEGQEHPEFSADGERIVTASGAMGDDKVAVWNGRTGEALVSFVVPLKRNGDLVASVHFDASGERIVTASSDKIARIFDTQTGKLLLTLGDFDSGGHAESLTNARFSADGRHVVTASSDKTAIVWDAATGDLIARLAGHSELVGDAVFSPDGQRIVTTGNDGTAYIWQAQTGKLLSIHDAQVRRAEFSPDGQRLATVSEDHLARLWPVEADRLEVTVKHQDNITDAQFSADGQRVITASRDGTARIWETRTGKLLSTCRGHTEGLKTAQFSPDGLLVLTASTDKTARLWDAGTGNLTQTHRLEEQVTAAHFSPDGQRVLTISAPRSKYKQVLTPDGKRGKVELPPYATVRIWAAASGKLLATLDEFRTVRTVSFSADGQRFVTSAAKEARMWKTQDGTLLEMFVCKDGSLEGAQVSADGRFTVGVCHGISGQAAEVWESETGKSLNLSRPEQRVDSAAFSPDGKVVLTTSENIGLWDRESGSLLKEMRSKGAGSTGVFIGSAQRFLTAESAAELWDTEAGKLVAAFPATPHVEKIRAAVSNDGEYVVTIGLYGQSDVPFMGRDRRAEAADRTARIWTLLPPVAGVPPDWTPDFYHYLAGRRLNTDGDMEPAGPAELLALRERLRAIADAPSAAETPYLRVLRKFVGQPASLAPAASGTSDIPKSSDDASRASPQDASSAVAASSPSAAASATLAISATPR